MADFHPIFPIGFEKVNKSSTRIRRPIFSQARVFVSLDQPIIQGGMKNKGETRRHKSLFKRHETKEH